VTNGNASFYQCTFRSYQDTLYVGQTGNAVFSGGQVVGATDYVGGPLHLWCQVTGTPPDNMLLDLRVWQGVLPRHSACQSG
jgi:hypothetical protein